MGNPTTQYAETRHNAGFRFLDLLAAREGLSFVQESAMQGMVAVWRRSGGTVYLLKPMTYMNRSGLSVRALASFYRIDPSDMLVVHDELEFVPGVARLKRGGGHGGHNGLRDITAHLSGDFLRLRLGIGRPVQRERVASYVLERAPLAERQVLDEAIERSLSVLSWVLEGDVQRAMNSLNAI
nr:aminoacyl-tRNA hydrolase [Methylogaea oryzae]